MQHRICSVVRLNNPTKRTLTNSAHGGPQSPRVQYQFCSKKQTAACRTRSFSIGPQRSSALRAPSVLQPHKTSPQSLHFRSPLVDGHRLFPPSPTRAKKLTAIISQTCMTLSNQSIFGSRSSFSSLSTSRTSVPALSSHFVSHAPPSAMLGLHIKPKHLFLSIAKHPFENLALFSSSTAVARQPEPESIASHFNKAFDKHTTASKRGGGSETSSHGLLGFAHLKNPRDFLDFADKTVELSTQAVHHITQHYNEMGPSEIVQKLDHLSEMLCKVADPAEFIRHVHSSKHWRDAASQASAKMLSLINEINTNTGLYKAVLKAFNSNELSAEEYTIANQLKSEFELNGIHLPDELRNRVIDLQGHITEMGDQFLMETQTPEALRTVKIPVPEGTVVPPEFRQFVNIKGDHAIFSTDPNVLSKLLHQLPSDAIRRHAYVLSTSTHPRNLTTLSQLLMLRHQLATLMQYQSAAHMKVSPQANRCMKSPESVVAFLEEVANKIRPKVEEEMDCLRKEKARLTNEATPTIYAWDKDFLIHSRKSKQESNAVNCNDYFSLGSAVEGLRLVSEKLFKLHLRVVVPGEGELWHPSVKKVEVWDDVEQAVVGYVYMDLLPRFGKFQYAATFNLQFAKVDEKEQLVQPAKIGLVCNFDTEGSSAGKDVDQPTLLTHTELETLFHEWGHCLHSLLSRTRYQHCAGTRAPLDFVETPSTLMENFVWDYRVVREFARHWRTGDVMPEAQLDALRRQKKEFAGLQLLNQAVCALFDLQLHLQAPDAIESPDLMHQIEAKHSPIPPVPDTHWHTRFGHLTNYEAGYYCYLFCCVFSTNIWKSCFLKDPLNTDAGMRYRQGILRYGGSEDPMRLIEELIGQKPTGILFSDLD